ncbi:MAG: hypothetical protein WBA89_23090 [Microcoleus sp.]
MQQTSISFDANILQTSGTFIEHSPSSLLTGHRSGIQLPEIAAA